MSRQGRRARRERRERIAKAGPIFKRYSGQETEAHKALASKATEAILDERCPDCGGVTVGKSGRWRCVAKKRKLFGRRVRQGERVATRMREDSLRYLRCGASGTIMQDGSLAVLVGGVKRKEDEDG